MQAAPADAQAGAGVAGGSCGEAPLTHGIPCHSAGIAPRLHMLQITGPEAGAHPVQLSGEWHVFAAGAARLKALADADMAAVIENLGR